MIRGEQTQQLSVNKIVTKLEPIFFLSNFINSFTFLFYFKVQILFKHTFVLLFFNCRNF